MGAPVALRKESVDRNRDAGDRAAAQTVALRKESVDRNKYVVQCRKVMGVVALRKESVDRNVLLLLFWSILRCRSPQGERG